MKALRSRLRIVAALALIFLLPTAAIRAQDASKAAVVIAVKNLDEIFGDFTAVAQWAGAADQIGFPLMLARGTTSKVDQNKPIGGFLTFENGELRPLIFIPVSDLNGLFNQLKEQIGSPKELEKGLYELRAGGQPMFVREGDGWAFLSNDRQTLNNTPEQPAETIAALTKNYDLAVQFNIQNVPEDLRQVALTQIKTAMEAAAQGARDNPALQEQMRKNVQKQMTQIVEETDSITIGLSIDSEQQNISAEFAMTAKEGSELAKQLAASSNVKSAFAGLASAESAVSMNFVGKLTDEDTEQLLSTLKNAREQASKHIENGGHLPDDNSRQAAQSAVNSIFDAFEATVKGGMMDFCLAVNLDEDEFHLIAGGLLAEGGKLESGIKQIVDIAKNDANFPEVHLNVGAHQGVNFHTIEVPLNDADENIQNIFGETVEVTLGIGKDRMFVAVGDDGVGAIKQAMKDAASGNAKSAQPMQMIIALAPILKFAANSSEDVNLERIAKALAQTEGKDHIRVTARVIPRGQIVRFEIEQGVLKAIGGAAGGRNGRGGF